MTYPVLLRLNSDTMSRILFVLVIIGLLFSCKPSGNSPQTAGVVASDYREPYRPQYHFSPSSGWMNDPNGMVFHNGEYHLFYQHYPDSTVWGPMHWGHAVSTDLVHWEQLPIALYPDSLGYIFSGSAVVDRNNTTGFGTADKPALVAMFTYHDPAGEKAGRNDFQTQGLAYSNDNGRTWVKFKGNPVLKNPGIRDFRDPKVRWWEEQKKWLLTLAVKDHVEFYSSPDMKSWTRLSAFGEDIGAHGGVWECPDFFPMTDAQGQQRWVLLLSINPGGPQGGSATQYFVGSFNGKVFVPQDTLTRWIDYGADNYAGVTWSDIPEADGRRLFMGWMSNWQYANVVPTGVWRSAMTLPREIRMMSRGGVHELQFRPADELEHITGEPVAYSDSAALTATASRIRFKSAGTEGFSFSLHNAAQERVTLTLADGKLSFDRRESGRSGFSDVFPAVHEIDLTGVDLREVDIWLDAASLEIFINEGERVITELVFPTVSWNQIRLVRSNPNFTVQPVSRIWPEAVVKK